MAKDIVCYMYTLSSHLPMYVLVICSINSTCPFQKSCMYTKKLGFVLFYLVLVENNGFSKSYNISQIETYIARD